MFDDNRTELLLLCLLPNYLHVSFEFLLHLSFVLPTIIVTFTHIAALRERYRCDARKPSDMQKYILSPSRLSYLVVFDLFVMCKRCQRGFHSTLINYMQATFSIVSVRRVPILRPISLSLPAL